MPAIPSIASFTGASVTEGEFKTALSNLHLFLTGLLGTDGTQAGGQAALGALLGAGESTKTEAYTVTSADRGKVIACSGTFTVSLPDAAAVGAGFAVAVANYGGGTITVDPFSAQTIDGAETKTLSANTMMVACAVAGEWLSVGGVDAASTSKAGIVQLSTSVSSTSTTLAATSSAVKAAYDLAAAATTTAEAKLKTGATAGTHYQFVNSGKTAATAATKIIEARCLVGGTLRTHITVITSTASRTAYARIYKNGVEVGTLRSTTSTEGEVFTEDIAFSLGDLIQVYGYVNIALDSPICTVYLRLGAGSSSYGLLAVST